MCERNFFYSIIVIIKRNDQSYLLSWSMNCIIDSKGTSIFLLLDILEVISEKFDHIICIIIIYKVYVII